MRIAARLLFVFFSVVVAFALGILLAVITGAGEGQMLAGGAIVFFYGLVGAGMGLLLSIFLATQLDSRHVIRYNKVLGVFFFLFTCFVAYRWFTREPVEQETTPPRPKTTAPAQNARNDSDVFQLAATRRENTDVMGMGFFKPNYVDHPTLYFYGNVNLEKALDEHLPIDSLVFSPDPVQATTTTYAPPWLFPEHLKLDYGILFFKVLGEGHDFILVEANRATGRVAYLDKRAGTMLSWPQFLLSVNSVEFEAPAESAVHSKPLAHAGEITTPYAFMQPLLVRDEWMYVRLVDDSHAETGKGWIRWKAGQLLLITYSLLS